MRRAGCALGALIAGSPAMLLACALLFALYAALRLTNLKPNDLTCVLAAGLSAYLLPLLFAQNLYDHIMAAAGGLTAMVLSRMYATALRVRLQDRELLSPEEIISLSLLLAGVLTGFRQLAPWGISPVLAVLLFLCIGAGWLCGAGMGAAVGAVTGLMLGVTQPEAPYLLPGMVLSGLLPGLFARLGKWGPRPPCRWRWCWPGPWTRASSPGSARWKGPCLRGVPLRAGERVGAPARLRQPRGARAALCRHDAGRPARGDAREDPAVRRALRPHGALAFGQRGGRPPMRR